VTSELRAIMVRVPGVTQVDPSNGSHPPWGRNAQQQGQQVTCRRRSAPQCRSFAGDGDSGDVAECGRAAVAEGTLRARSGRSTSSRRRQQVLDLWRGVCRICSSDRGWGSRAGRHHKLHNPPPANTPPTASSKPKAIATTCARPDVSPTDDQDKMRPKTRMLSIAGARATPSSCVAARSHKPVARPPGALQDPALTAIDLDHPDPRGHLE